MDATVTTSRPDSHARSEHQRHHRYPQRVLACLSRSERAPAIAAEAWRIAQANGATCQFLHVGENEADARAHLRGVLAEARVPSEAPLWLHRGKPRHVIAQMVRRHEIDLVIAGVLNRHTTLNRHLCSIAGQIVSTVPCSVLLLTEPHVQQRPWTRMAAAVDFDELSHEMLGSILPWSRREDVRHWHIIYEYDPSGFFSQLDNLEAVSRAARLRRLEAFIRAFDWSGQYVQHQCVLNKHGCDALWYAQQIKADLLCLPLSHRRQDFWARVQRFRLDVDIHALPCAVLLFRQNAGPERVYQAAS